MRQLQSFLLGTFTQPDFSKVISLFHGFLSNGPRTDYGFKVHKTKHVVP